ncbi:MAG: hypothetical protein KDA85_13340, partial [Planctomycetaceae bacterium]|nr:hypothetical protein [Planctomycetaceae bacterium]
MSEESIPASNRGSSASLDSQKQHAPRQDGAVEDRVEQDSVEQDSVAEDHDVWREDDEFDSSDFEVTGCEADHDFLDDGQSSEPVDDG